MNSSFARTFAIVAGIVLVGIGLLGFIDNPIASTPENNPLFHVDPVHNIIHIVTGALSLFVGFGLRGDARANGLIAIGVGYGLVLLLTLIDNDAFGLLQHPVNMADHILHIALTAAFIGVGVLARNESHDVVRTR